MKSSNIVVSVELWKIWESRDNELLKHYNLRLIPPAQSGSAINIRSKSLMSVYIMCRNPRLTAEHIDFAAQLHIGVGPMDSNPVTKSNTW